jgi:hypothetical protein
MGNGIRRKDQKHTVRNRPDLMWRDSNINIYGFEDVNQMALDDRYGKVGAPLSKRRNGEGPAGRDAPPGLFGVAPAPELEEKLFLKGLLLLGSLYYLNR